MVVCFGLFRYHFALHLTYQGRSIGEGGSGGFNPPKFSQNFLNTGITLLAKTFL